MKKSILNFILCLGFAFPAFADDAENVVITDATEEYIITKTPVGFTVKTLQKNRYEATRFSETITPHVFYSDVVKLDKASGGTPIHRNANDPSVFHDDSRVCYFEIDLKEKGAKASSEFRTTITDGAYFCYVPLADVYPIRHKTVKIVIPQYYNHLELIEENIPQGCLTRTETTNSDQSRTVIFEISNLPTSKSEWRAPSLRARSPKIRVKGYFDDLYTLYKFHDRRLDVDTVIPDVNIILKDIIGEASDHSAKIDRIYKYVQRKIRYIAFEEGEAGYRPDAPAEVLRKQYGDCKGMALLLATLLNRAGIEAYTATVGTTSIPLKISESLSLSATNHMICIAPNDGDTLVLDATHNYIDMHHVPAFIQGKDAMLHIPGGYKMIDIPRLGAETSLENTAYDYRIVDGALNGKCRLQFTGDMLEFFRSAVDGLEKTLKSDALAIKITPRKKAKIDHSSITDTMAADGSYEVCADLTDGNAVFENDGTLYVDINPVDNSFIERIDLKNRTTDYYLPFRATFRATSTLEIPDGMEIGELPESFDAACHGVKFSYEVSYTDDNKIIATKTVKVEDTDIPFASLPRWNKIVADWFKATNTQIELKTIH